MVEALDNVTDISSPKGRREFDSLVQKYHKQAYNLAFRMSGNHTDAEDLTQEAFIRAYRFFGQYKREMPFESWLYRIVSNVFIDKIRRKPKTPIRSLDQPIVTELGEAPLEIPDNSGNPEDALLTMEMDIQIQEALKLLPEVFRMTVIYADIEGLSYEEIAEITKTNIGTVRSRLHRGRRILKESLEGYHLENL